MHKLSRSDLMPLERYAEQRAAFRQQVLAHKKRRSIALGPHMTLLFEDRLTVQYQVQEMLRIERIFEAAGIEDELSAYNPLIPDGDNLKATLLIEFPDPAIRAMKLAEWRGIEHALYLQVGDGPRIPVLADEDLERSNDSKTSAVHFLRFAFEVATITTLRQGAPMWIGVDDPRYPQHQRVESHTRDCLLADFV